jgi:hypothetical protein
VSIAAEQQSGRVGYFFLCMAVRPRSTSLCMCGSVGASIRVIARSLRNMSEHEFMLNAGWGTLDSDTRAESNRATEALKQSVPLRLCAVVYYFLQPEKDISNY